MPRTVHSRPVSLSLVSTNASSISLFLGRPLAIQDGGFTIRLPANIDDDELPLVPRHNWPLTKITKSTFLILHYRLAQIIGRIQTNCFGLGRREHTEVMACERLMLDWSANLPPVFRLDAPDKSMDEAHPWLGFQRQSLSSKYYQARISLHRPYLLTQLNDPDMSSELRTSLDACVFSALAELSLRLSMREVDADPFDRFKWMTVSSPHGPTCSRPGSVWLLPRHSHRYPARLPQAPQAVQLCAHSCPVHRVPRGGAQDVAA